MTGKRLTWTLPLTVATLLAGCCCAVGWATDFTLNVGGPADDQSLIRPIFLSGSSGLSDRQGDPPPGLNWRTLSNGGVMRFELKQSALDPNWVDSQNGVAKVPVIIEVTYQDLYANSPVLSTRLDYGIDPMLDWYSLGTLASDGNDQWRTAKLFIEATPWETLRAIDGRFKFELEYPAKDPNFTLPVDKVKLRFVDNTTFYRERTADRHTRWGEGTYRDANPPLELSGTNYAIFVHNYLEKIYPTTIPDPSTVLDPNDANAGLSLFEVPGEREPVTFGIYAVDNLHDVAVSVSDLVLDPNDPNSPVIDPNQIAIERVVPRDVHWWYAANYWYGPNPWYLDDGQLFDILIPTGDPNDPNSPYDPEDPHVSQQVWITVNVPAATAPGTYRGTMTVSSPDMEPNTPRVLPLALTVYNVELRAPDARPYLYWSPYSYYVHPLASDPNTAARDMGEHSTCPIILFDGLGIDPNCAYDPNNPSSLCMFPGALDTLASELRALRDQGALSTSLRVYVGNLYGIWRKRGCPPEDPNAGTYFMLNPCPVFDQQVGDVMAACMDVFEAFYTDPNNFEPGTPYEVALSFTDEPTPTTGRRAVSYLGRLAHDAGFKTWVTCNNTALVSSTEAGHHLVFQDRFSNLNRTVPGALNDPNLVSHWTFDSNFQDALGRNNGAAHGNASISGGLLNVAGPNDYMYVSDPNDHSLDVTSSGSLYIWFKPTACPLGASPLVKSPARPNYRLGALSASSTYPDRFVCRGFQRGYERDVSGSMSRSCGDPYDSQWYNVIWTYSAELGSAMYVNGTPYVLPSLWMPKVELEPSTGELRVGGFNGQVDDVMFFNAAFDPNLICAAVEAMNTSSDPNQTPYDCNQQATLRFTIDDPNYPDTLTFYLSDLYRTPAAIESVKTLAIEKDSNQTVLWTAAALESTYYSHSVSVPSVAVPFDLVFSVRNNHARDEDITLYFVEDFWRGLDPNTALSSNWTCTSVDDPAGNLGPMDLQLDDIVYSMANVTQETVDRARDANVPFTYYTTYPATIPVPIYNRLLMGLYAHSVGARGVYVWTYGGWNQPWDDCAAPIGNYLLTLPSWADRVYDTVTYEALREGIEDSRIIVALNAAIALDPNTERAQRARSYLDDDPNGLSAKFSPDFWRNYFYVDDSLPIEQRGDRSKEILSDLCSDPNSFAAFDAVRLQMLHYIVLLNGDAIDCNGNDHPDDYDIAHCPPGDPNCADCNGNGIPDACDISLHNSLDCNGDGVPDECQGVCRADANCDGSINYGDINAFTLALNSLSAWQAQYPTCPWQNVDANGDCSVNYADINAFTALLNCCIGPCP